MDIRRATALLYGLQLARNNSPPSKRITVRRRPVDDIVTTEDGAMIAPVDRVTPDMLDKEDWIRRCDEILDGVRVRVLGRR